MRINFKSRPALVLILAGVLSALLIFAIERAPRSTSAASSPQAISHSAFPRRLTPTWCGSRRSRRGDHPCRAPHAPGTDAGFL